MSEIFDADKLQQQRMEKLEKIKNLGVAPYGSRIDGIEPTAAVRARFDSAKTGQRALCGGRIVLHRDIGKLVFITLRDSSGSIQLGLSKQLLAGQWELVKLLDLGDLISAEGEVGLTKTGELTIWADKVTLLAKCLMQPPEKFHGLADIDLRYRQRYVDLWANPDVMGVFKKRVAIISAIRQFLSSRGFLEVETPMMQTIAGGAAARPFITHHNTLDMDLYLRIAPELYLKRLLVGGMERVFEINRNFRNEGISPRHNPEFTMMEIYQAYGDYNTMMDLTEEMFSVLLDGGEPVRQFGEMEIDFSRPFRKARYKDLFKEYSGSDIDDIASVRKKAASLGIDEGKLDDDVVVSEVFEATVEDKLISPTFVLDYPAKLCPLTKRCPDDPKYAQRFELYIGKMELANAYSELNDPQVQYENFLSQLKGGGEEENAFRNLDEDFINALKYGMPPAGGLGVGIDRLAMLLTSSASIKDVILFPLLKAEKKNCS